jgi:hypothetical protein
MELRWEILLQRQGTVETVPVCSVGCPVNGATPLQSRVSCANAWSTFTARRNTTGLPP